MSVKNLVRILKLFGGCIRFVKSLQKSLSWTLVAFTLTDWLVLHIGKSVVVDQLAYYYDPISFHPLLCMDNLNCLDYVFLTPAEEHHVC